MAIHDLWSYDHAPQGTTDVSGGTTLTAYVETNNYNLYTGLPGMVYKNTSGVGQLTTDGFLTLTTGSGANPVLLVQAQEVQNWGTPTQYWIGFRTKIPGTQNAATCRIFTISDSLAQTNNVVLLSESDMTAAGANTSALEYYVEIFIDRTNLVYQVWVNGTQIKNGTLPTAAMVANGLSYYWWGAYGSASATNGAARAFRDYYFLDIDTTDTGRLGAIRSSLQNTATIAAPNALANVASLVGTAGITSAQAMFGSNSFTCGATAGSCALVPDVPSSRLTGDYTIEFWSYNPSPGTSTMYLNKGTNTYLFNNAGQLYVQLDSGATITLSGKLVANTWQHLAFVKFGTSFMIFVNGVLGVTTTITAAGTFGNNTSSYQIGSWTNNTDLLVGYLDEFRISNLARYTAAFTPPAAPFTGDANTMLLLHFESATMGGLADSSGQGLSNILQTPYTTPPVVTPNIVNSPTNDPITAGFGATTSASKIIGVDFRVAGQAVNGPSMAAALQQGSNNLPFSTYAFNDLAANYGRRMGMTRTAPDGGAWTPAKISATSLILTPAT
jgi:hypothetical protein